MKLTIEEHRVVTLAYELRDGHAQGELLERMDSRYPFIFLFGTGKLLKSFEDQIRGLGMDNSFEFVLKAADAYGHKNALNILKLPIEDFKRASNLPDDYIEVGNLVNVTDDGNLKHNGKILSVTDPYVEVDFNHVMVDKDLYFKGVVLHVREATMDELLKRHYIQPAGVTS